MRLELHFQWRSGLSKVAQLIPLPLSLPPCNLHAPSSSAGDSRDAFSAGGWAELQLGQQGASHSTAPHQSAAES